MNTEQTSVSIQQTPEHSYADYYWITLENFNEEEWERFKQDLSPFTKLFTFDGFDEETKSVCVKFSRYRPKNGTPEEIFYCKKKNSMYKREFLKAFQQDIRGKVYFNIKRGTLKKL